MLKDYTKKVRYSLDDVIKIFMKFYEQVKHGDAEHQKWLLEETMKFLAEEIKLKVKEDDSKEV